MAEIKTERLAFGGPGLEPRWTSGAKDGVGTAYNAACRIWFTLSNGILTEVYYPNVDRPQLRDLQYLVTDGESFFHEESRDLDTTTESIQRNGLAYRITNRDPAGRYQIVKEVITDPDLPVVLLRTKLQGEEQLLRRLRFYALCAPRLELGGWGNNGRVVEVAGQRVVAAEKDGTWLVLCATVPFSRVSCGYVGTSDGWTDLADNYRMDWEFDSAPAGNVALMAELDRQDQTEFTLALGLGDSLESAGTSVLQSLGLPYAARRKRYLEQWDRPCRRLLELDRHAGDQGNLYRRSASLLLAHEDKQFPGALIASLSIPWGEAKGDEDQGGYHLVWTRDMVNSAGGLLAAGHTGTALRALIYLAVAQRPDGGFPQNFWINGRSYWQGIQLDEVAFPILLAWRLHEAGALEEFDPYPMVRAAAAFLVRHGPATQQERWEEASGYSPSTLAVNVAALIAAACFARARGDDGLAIFLEEYADFLECHIEAWTVTTEGTLLPDVPRHYIRIHPVAVGDPHADEDPNHGELAIANRPPGSRWRFPAREVVDAGFLELVRYGVRRAGDALIEDSLRVVDSVLRVETPAGPVWRRYNHDGYGQRADGGPYVGSGQGRGWPLLTGERGHYELAAGRDATRYLRALERCACASGLLPEQVWDEPDRPERGMRLGGPTGAAMPLMWAHAEYIKLLRSTADGAVFDHIPAVAERYLGGRRACRPLEVWKRNRQPFDVAVDHTLRIQAPRPFRLRWTRDDWARAEDTDATPTGLGIAYVDLPADPAQRAPYRFTFYWTDEERWEGKDYSVTVTPARGGAAANIARPAPEPALAGA